MLVFSGLSGTTLIVGATFVALLAVIAAVNRAKGLGGVEVSGVPVPGVFGLFADLVGLFRLAKPHSWWARRFYSDEKLARAGAHHSRPRPRPALDEADYSEKSAK